VQPLVSAAPAHRREVGRSAVLIIPSPWIIVTGMLIGVVVSAPVGPVNVLCIQRTFERGFFAGLAAGTGAVLGDGLLALLAAFGINAISDTMEQNKTQFQLFGGLVLLAFGIRLFFAPPKLDAQGQTLSRGKEGFWAYVWSIPQTFFLTITNPGAVLGMFAIVGGAGSVIGGLNTYTETITLVLAIMGGGFLWWFCIARVVSTFRHRLSERHILWINQAAGLLLILSGLAAVGQLALKFLR
jgi:threonine/homoserine/homoserine lactone efflux protein